EAHRRAAPGRDPAALLAQERGVPPQRGAGHEHPGRHSRAHARGRLRRARAARGREDRAGGDARGPRAGAGGLHHAALQQSGPGGSGDRGAAVDWRRRHLVTRSVVALAGLALLAASGSGQQPPVFHIDLDLVNVTVTVRDARGGLISDLHEEDFEILEDGRPQKVQLFAPAASPEERKELALNLGMLFDTSESMRKDLRLSQQSAVRFLDAIPRARDLVLVFFDRDIRLSRYSSENQQGILERILETEGGGDTALLDAITVYVS